MAAIASKSGVEVCIWVAKDEKGSYVSAFTGGLNDGQGEGRVGHASMKIFPPDTHKGFFEDLMKGEDHVYVSLWPGQFRYTLDEDVEAEAGKQPNAIIHLNKLDEVKMLTELQKVLVVLGDDPNWKLLASAKTSLSRSAQSCSSFVYKLLEIGGIFNKAVYGKSASYSGPYRDFYNKSNCHLGDIMRGFWNGMPWRAWVISPKLVLHVAASAAESDPTDKQETLALMVSELVHKDEPAAASGAVFGGAVLAGVGTVAYMQSKKSGV